MTAEKAAGDRKSSLLRRLREAVVTVLESDDDSNLQELVVEADLCGKVMILGELVLTLSALEECGGKEEAVGTVADRAFELAGEVTARFGEAADRIGEGDELWWHGSALREWAHLLAEHFGGIGDCVRQAEMPARAYDAGSALVYCPNLVGPAFLEMGLVAESLGDVEMAKSCCDSVRKDLRYVLDRPDGHDRLSFEEISTLYWLQRSCEELRRLAPGHPEAGRDLQRVVEIRTKRGDPDDVSEPRFGPIAAYLGKDRFLVWSCVTSWSGTTRAGTGNVSRRPAGDSATAPTTWSSATTPSAPTSSGSPCSRGSSCDTRSRSRKSSRRWTSCAGRNPGAMTRRRTDLRVRESDGRRRQGPRSGHRVASAGVPPEFKAVRHLPLLRRLPVGQAYSTEVASRPGTLDKVICGKQGASPDSQRV